MRISDWSSDVCSSDLAKYLEVHVRGFCLVPQNVPIIAADAAQSLGEPEPLLACSQRQLSTFPIRDVLDDADCSDWPSRTPFAGKDGLRAHLHPSHVAIRANDAAFKCITTRDRKRAVEGKRVAESG